MHSGVCPRGPGQPLGIYSTDIAVTTSNGNTIFTQPGEESFVESFSDSFDPAWKLKKKVISGGTSVSSGVEFVDSEEWVMPLGEYTGITVSLWAQFRAPCFSTSLGTVCCPGTIMSREGSWLWEFLILNEDGLPTVTCGFVGSVIEWRMAFSLPYNGNFGEENGQTYPSSTLRETVAFRYDFDTELLETWNFYTVVFDGVEAKLYINGTEVFASAPRKVPQLPSLPNTASWFRIGFDIPSPIAGSSSPNIFNGHRELAGTYDEFRLYDEALGAEQILELFNDQPIFPPDIVVEPEVTATVVDQQAELSVSVLNGTGEQSFTWREEGCKITTPVDRFKSTLVTNLQQSLGETEFSVGVLDDGLCTTEEVALHIVGLQPQFDDDISVVSNYFGSIDVSNTSTVQFALGEEITFSFNSFTGSPSNIHWLEYSTKIQGRKTRHGQATMDEITAWRNIPKQTTTTLTVVNGNSSSNGSASGFDILTGYDDEDRKRVPNIIMRSQIKCRIIAKDLSGRIESRVFFLEATDFDIFEDDGGGGGTDQTAIIWGTIGGSIGLFLLTVCVLGILLFLFIVWYKKKKNNDYYIAPPDDWKPILYGELLDKNTESHKPLWEVLVHPDHELALALLAHENYEDEEDIIRCVTLLHVNHPALVEYILEQEAEEELGRDDFYNRTVGAKVFYYYCTLYGSAYLFKRISSILFRIGLNLDSDNTKSLLNTDMEIDPSQMIKPDHSTSLPARQIVYTVEDILNVVFKLQTTPAKPGEILAALTPLYNNNSLKRIGELLCNEFLAPFIRSPHTFGIPMAEDDITKRKLFLIALMVESIGSNRKYDDSHFMSCLNDEISRLHSRLMDYCRDLFTDDKEFIQHDLPSSVINNGMEVIETAISEDLIDSLSDDTQNAVHSALEQQEGKHKRKTKS